MSDHLHFSRSLGDPKTLLKPPPLPLPLNIAHRGASGYAPENTLIAFQMAIEMGAKMIELDLHLTKDGVPVVLHDPSLWRTAGVRRNVGSLTLKEIKRLEVGSWFNPQFKDQKIPTLEEVLDLVGGRISLNIELKQGTTPYPGLPEKLFRILEDYHIVSTTLVSSFQFGVMEDIKRKFPESFLGYLSHREALQNIIRHANRLEAYSIQIPFRKINAELVQRAHLEGFKIFSYTVNTTEDMKRFLKLGIDGLYTNFPDRMTSILNAPH